MSSREYVRDDMKRLIRKCEVWADQQGYALSLDSRYPRLPMDGYSDDRARWHAWIVDSMLNCAHAVLVATDLKANAIDRVDETLYALRCSWQMANYRGRANDTMPDASWYDYTSTVRNAVEYLMRKINVGEV